jgi:hypothetical protein
MLGIAMASGGADGISRRNDARAHDDALFYRLLERNIIVVGGTHIADRRETGRHGF